MKRVAILLVLCVCTGVRAVDMWVTEVVEDGWSVGQYTSIAVLSPASLAISYYDAGKNDLRFAWFHGNAWQTCVVDDSANTGLHSTVLPAPSQPVCP